MKNTVFSTLVAFLLIVCVCTSCTQTQAQTKNEISTEKIASEISRSEILLSEKEHLSKVKAIIDETRVAYSKYDVIKISPNQSIQTSKFIHSSEKTSEELYFEYNEYLNSFNTVVLGVLKNIYGENVVTYNFEEGDNYIMPTYIVPDLNGSGFNSSKEAVENFRKNQGSASYDVIIIDTVLYTVKYYNAKTNEKEILFPSESELAKQTELYDSMNNDHLTPDEINSYLNSIAS